MELKLIETRTFEKLMQKLMDLLEKSKAFSPKKDTQWLDNSDVCRKLDVSKRTLQSYRDRGLLSYSQIGHKCYYKSEDIKMFVEQRKNKMLNQ